MDEEYSEGDEPRKVYLGPTTYVTRREGELVMVRSRTSAFGTKAIDIARDLLGEAFRIPRRLIWRESSMDYSQSEEGNLPTCQSNLCQQTPSGFHNQTVSPMQTYDHKGQQLVLLPIGSAAVRPTFQQQGYPFQNAYQRSNPLMIPGNLPGGVYNQFTGFPTYLPLYGAQGFAAEASTPTQIGDATGTAGTAIASVHDGKAVAPKPICAGCGRVRSNKYQHENPLKPGQTPSESYCKKCQREATSSEGSSNNDQDSHAKPKKMSKRNQYRRKSNIDRKECEVNGDYIESQESNEIAQLTKNDKQVTSQDYVMLDEDSINEDSKGPSRAKRVVQISEDRRRRSPSPLLELVPRCARCINSSQMYSPQKPNRQELRENITESIIDRENDFSYLDQLGYRALRREFQGIGFEEGGKLYLQRTTPTKPKDDEFEASQYQANLRGEKETDGSYRQIRNRERDHIGGKIRTETRRSQESSNRRRRERRLQPKEPGQPQHQAEEFLPPSLPRPLHDNEIVVVTERYVYRPRRITHVEEEGQPRDAKLQIGKPKLEGRNKNRQFLAEGDISEDYNGDCNRRRSPDERQFRRRIRPRDLEDRFTQMALSRSSEASSDAYCTVQHEPHLPESQSLQRRIVEEASPDYWPEEKKHSRKSHLKTFTRGASIDSSSEISFRLEVPSALNESEISSTPAEQYMKPSTSEDRYSQDSRATSNHRPPYVREATDGGTEKATITSPHHSLGRRRFVDDRSETTIEIERPETRHVTFNDAIDPFLISDEWLTECYKASNDAGREKANSPEHRTKW